MTPLSPRAQDVWDSFWEGDVRTPSSFYNHNIAEAFRAAAPYCTTDYRVLRAIAAEIDEQ